VEDAGPGIPREERDRVFERFARGSAVAGRRGAGSGTGLGLALVAEHVKLHGGRVWVETSPAGGARFVVELPLPLPGEAADIDETHAEQGYPTGNLVEPEGANKAQSLGDKQDEPLEQAEPLKDPETSRSGRRRGGDPGKALWPGSQRSR